LQNPFELHAQRDNYNCDSDRFKTMIASCHDTFYQQQTVEDAAFAGSG
jgi:hypothetical protein